MTGSMFEGCDSIKSIQIDSETYGCYEKAEQHIFDCQTTQ